jgi:thiol-disulfide isomerase/thioredoxin
VEKTTSSDTMMDKKSNWKKEEMDAMKDDHMMSGATMMKDDHMKMNSGAVMADGYVDYTPELLASNLASGKKVTLFFAATWCPSCQALNKTLEASESMIPSDTIIMNVNYDNSADLKKKYGVVTQHTTVVLNNDGSMKSKKIGAQTLDEVIGK